MRLDYALTVCDPRSVMVAEIQQATSGSSGLSKADIMTALGMLQKREHAGLALLYAKYLKHEDELSYALEALWDTFRAKHRTSNARTMNVMRQLVAVAVFDYCRTPEDKAQQCPACKGRKEVRDREAEQALFEQCSKVIEITKPCKRCHGTGLKPFSKSTVVKLVQQIIPKVSERTIYRNYMPIYDEMVQWCYVQENAAMSAYVRLALR